MFITKADLNTSLYPEIAQAIARYSEAIILAKLATAESEIESYLSLRFLIRPELDKVGDARPKLLLSIGLDLAIYHLYASPESIPTHRVKRYEQGIKMLELMARGTIGLPGVPLAPADAAGGSGALISFGSEPRRPSGW